ncbi:MAG: hypothetical protein PHH54_03640 [Candidatus Nanoarchaeia archaeon]|nr:hypothetical protein [Candidatus Nanoarchaeia archaeon]MDD5741051.1 hypothetical protein [Candidatus Nanoarchaeia archaeon]
MNIIKKVRAPVRIDFAGGTTDISPFRDKYGGCVLNATINRYVYGKLIATDKKTELEYHADIPTSSGLGTSSAMNDVWVALITHHTDKNKIAEAVFKIEHAIKESSINGKQDQYAAAFGGINFMEFSGDKVKVTKLNLSSNLIKELEQKLVLVYIGPHYSGDSNKRMIDNLKKGKNIKNLLRIKKIAIEMKNALLKKDLIGFAKLMNEETAERKKLAKGVVSKVIEEVIKEGMQNGAKAAKVCGSGGGGSVLFFGDKQKLKRRFGGKVLDFKFDFKGLRWV